MQKEKPSKIVEHDKVIPNLVEEAGPKKMLNEILKSGKELRKGKKIISSDDDVDFDAVLSIFQHRHNSECFCRCFNLRI